MGGVGMSEARERDLRVAIARLRDPHVRGALLRMLMVLHRYYGARLPDAALDQVERALAKRNR